MKFIKRFIELIVYYIAFLIPRRKAYWLFGGALDKFVGNAKYAFFYVNEEYKNVNPIWLTKDERIIKFLRSKGYETYKSTSFKGLFLQLISKVIIYDSELSDFAIPWLTGGAIRINLWHGVTLKQIGWDVKSRTKENILDKLRLRYLRLVGPPNYVCTTSSKLLNIFSSAFRIHKDKIIIGGYHRTLPFYYNEAELSYLMQKLSDTSEIEIYDNLSKDKRYKVIYMPTFRDGNPYYFDEAIPDLEKLNKICKEHNILFIIKAHRFTKIDISTKVLSNITVLDKSCDVYPLLPLTDLLITDYSSIIFDYQLLNKPIVYYAYDLQQYIKESRELYFPYDDICPKECQVHEFTELIRVLENIESVEGFLKKEKSFFDHPTDFYSHFSQILVR